MSAESSRSDSEVSGMSVIEHYKRALGQIAGEWHARRLPDGERFGCSCPEFAREVLNTAPPDDTQGAVDALWREIHRTNHRSYTVEFGKCRMCEQDAKRLGVTLPGGQ